jgi:hypothetical protein
MVHASLVRLQATVVGALVLAKIAGKISLGEMHAAQMARHVAACQAAIMAVFAIADVRALLRVNLERVSCELARAHASMVAKCARERFLFATVHGKLVVDEVAALAELK